VDMPAAGSWGIPCSTFTVGAVAKGVLGGSFFMTAVEFCILAGGIPHTDDMVDLFTKVVDVDGGGGATEGCTEMLCWFPSHSL
jgi:hypothetical protein